MVSLCLTSPKSIGRTGLTALDGGHHTLRVFRVFTLRRGVATLQATHASSNKLQLYFIKFTLAIVTVFDTVLVKGNGGWTVI